jgi:CrcB protein
MTEQDNKSTPQPPQPDSHPELPLDPDIVLPRIKQPIHLVQEYQLTVFVGGCLGALARYGVALLYPDKDGTWPTATFLVNMAGAFVLGCLLEGLARRGEDAELRRFLRLGIGTGFIGAFTTYSTLATDADLLMKDNHLALAIAYTLISVAGGLLFSAVGIKLATAHHKLQRVRSNA